MATDPAGKNYGVQVGQAVTTKLGGAWTPEKAKFFNAWAQAEGTVAKYNPFATTRSGYQGEANFNSVGVKHFPSLQIGIQATADTIQNGYYDSLVNLIRDPDATAEDLAKAVANSPWGTGTGVLRVLGSNPEAFEKVVVAKETTKLRYEQDAATYGSLRGETEAIHQSLDLAPSAMYLDHLRSQGGLGARLAGISERAGVDFEAAQAAQQQQRQLQFAPVADTQETAAPAKPATSKAPPQFTPTSGDDLSMSVGGVKYNNLGGPEEHGRRALGNWQSDNAWDLGVPVGTPIYAVRDGVVGSNFGVQDSRPNDGARLEAGGVWYGHLSRVAVKPGQTIKRGQLIGYSGASQNGVAHLHIGFHPQGGHE